MNMPRLIYFVAVLLPLLSGCSSEPSSGLAAAPDSLPYYDEATFTPHWFDSPSEVPEAFHRISAFTLTNQVGDTVSEGEVSGKITISDFFFTTCPGICADMTANMKPVQEAFAGEPGVVILSHTVTPSIDTVETMHRFGEENEIDVGTWHLLTGTRQAIYRLAREDYFVEEDFGMEQGPDDFVHTENFVLVDGAGHIRGIYNGLRPTSVRQLIGDARRLLAAE